MKFKMLLKIFAVVLSLSAVALLAAGCSSGKSQPVVWIENENGEILCSMDRGMFSYFASEQKTVNLYKLLGGDSQNFATYAKQYDTPDFWNQLDSEGKVTFGQTVFDEAIRLEAQKVVIATYLFDEVYGLECPDEVYEKIDGQMTSLQKSQGSAKALESYLVAFGATPEQVRKLSEMQYKKSLLENAMFNESAGGTPITDESIRGYFKKNYSIVKHILVNTAFVTKDDGTTREPTAQELEQKLAEVAAIEARIAAGEDFDALAEEYKDGDPVGYANNPHGYFVTNDNTFTPEFQEAAVSMKEGEIKTVKTAYGTHIIKKYPMNEELFNAYEDIYTAIQATVKNEILKAFYEDCMTLVKTDEEIISEYDIIKISMLLG